MNREGVMEPTMQIDIFGNKHWFLNGELHRVDGPAVEWADGSRKWYLDGELHREDGPAIEWANGSKLWYLNDKFHRVDGPAVENAGGSQEWWVNGIQMDPLVFWLTTKERMESV